MKKSSIFLSSVLALFLLAGYTHAQVFMVVNGETSTPYNNLEAAITAAPAGSTVFIPTGDFAITGNPSIQGANRPTTLHIDKKLTLIGAGSEEGALHATILRGQVTCTTGASGSYFEGITITGDLRLDNVSDLTFKRGKFNYAYLSGKGDGNIIRESTMVGVKHLQAFYGNEGRPANGTFTEVFIQNNVVTASGAYSNPFSSLRKAIITNNVIVGGTYASNVFPNIYDCVVSNNIILENAAHNPDAGGSSRNIYTFNLLVGSFGASAAANYNSIGENIEKVFLVDIFEDQVRYKLKETCVGKGAGADGTDMGIYGGLAAKEKRIPAHPSITEFLVGGTSNTEGELSVRIKVEAQEK